MKLALVVLRGRESGVQRGDDLRAFANGSGDSFYRARPNVTDRIDAAAIGFEGVPMRTIRRAGQHESLCIQRNAGTGEPTRIRIGADEQEHVPEWLPRFVLRSPSTPADRFQNAVVSFEICYIGVREHFDIGQAGDPIYEVA